MINEKELFLKMIVIESLLMNQANTHSPIGDVTLILIISFIL